MYMYVIRIARLLTLSNFTYMYHGIVYMFIRNPAACRKKSSRYIILANLMNQASPFYDAFSFTEESGLVLTHSSFMALLDLGRGGGGGGSPNSK